MNLGLLIVINPHQNHFPAVILQDILVAVLFNLPDCPFRALVPFNSTINAGREIFFSG